MEAWVERYIGVPYLEHGRDLAGCDCWGLVRLVLAQQWGVDVPSLTSDYEAVSAATTAALIDEQSAAINAEKVTDPRPGDIAVIRVVGVPSHVGIVVAPGFVLHVKRGTEALVERLDSPAIVNRLEGFYRVH